MVKKAILLFTAAACFIGGAVKAQKHHCFADEMNARAKALNPAAVAAAEAQLKADIDAALGKMNLPNMKVTSVPTWADDTVFHIPIVFHVVHNYGREYISDNEIYQALDDINELYRGANSDTSDVIRTYKGNIPGTPIKYIANPRIQFHLARKDPYGNPTTGITRRRDHSTNTGGDHAKFDLWPPDNYLNIWIVSAFDENHPDAAAYAYKPAAASIRPWFDGPITAMGQSFNYDNTLGHEIGHYLDLDHPWGSTNNPEVTCGDDGIHDTPPTDGHKGGCLPQHLYDYNCVLTDARIGKININDSFKTISHLNNEGIKFRLFDKTHIDFVNIYPADSGKQFTIVLKQQDTAGAYHTIGSHTGTTLNNKKDTSIGQPTVFFINSPASVSDTFTGLGITFRVYDSLYIRNITFFPDSAARADMKPYQIVLKRNNIVINTFNDLVDTTTPSTNAEIAHLNFSISPSNPSDIYSIEFSVNPGVRRSTGNNITYRTIPGIIDIVSDTAHGRYNYFYQWNIRTFNYKQLVPVRFVARVDTQGTALTRNFAIDFSNNPGMRVDKGSALTTIKPTTPPGNYGTLGNVLVFSDDTSAQNNYNFFYDWVFRYGDYFQTYSAAVAHNLFNTDPNITGLVKIDYPDTVNAQNVMDYTYCSKMFTYLQGVHMRGALKSNVGGRINLRQPANLMQTGVINNNGSFTSRPDLPPVADFSTNVAGNISTGFACQGNYPGSLVTFMNRSWRDTVSKITWTFSNGAATPSYVQNNPGFNASAISNKFTMPGWVTVQMIAESNAGKDTLVSSNRVYIANDTAISANGYYQEFNPGTDIGQYPIFNHFNNFTTWEVTNNAGLYDNTSMRYKQFDNRQGLNTLTGTPRGDIDDFFTRALDMRGMGSTIYLTFYTSGAFRTNHPSYMRDTLEISYTTDCGFSWTRLKNLTKGEIGNNGSVLTEWTPTQYEHWQAHNIPITNATISEGNRGRVFFRFRYKPGADQNLIGSGNDFYLDRINISSWTTDVNDLANKTSGFTLAPNPTTGTTAVIIKDAKNTSAQITVTDVTGKVVYRTQASLNSGLNRIEIPANYISVKGVYLVSVTTDSHKQTEKLVVY